MSPVSDHIGTWPDTGMLDKSLRAAHIPFSGRQYFLFSVLVSFILAFLFLLTTFLMILSGFVVTHAFSEFIFIEGALLLFLYCLLFLFLLVYPFIASTGRKLQIERDLPSVIAYMEILSSSEPLFSIVKRVYENDDLYGEISKEFGIIVRDVEIFGDDLPAALRSLAEMTPSSRLRDLLVDLEYLLRSCGDFTNYFSNRYSYQRDRALEELGMQEGIKFNSVLVYIILFTGFPSVFFGFILINPVLFSSLLPLLLIVFPVGIIMYILVVLNVFREAPPPDFRTASVAGLLTGIPAATILGVLLYNLHTLPGSLFESQLWFSMIGLVILLPAAYLSYTKKLETGRMEYSLVGLAGDILDRVNLGMPLSGAISVSNDRLGGNYTRAVMLAIRNLQPGATLNTALETVDKNSGCVIERRLWSFISLAEILSSQRRKILSIALDDLMFFRLFHRQQVHQSRLCVLALYLAFGAFLGAMYALIGYIDPGTFDTGLLCALIFRYSLFLGLFTGLFAGLLSSHSIFAGLEHSFVFISFSSVLFASGL